MIRQTVFQPHSPTLRTLNAGRAAARRGAVAVEMAILAPFLAMLLLGICEIGQILRVNSFLSEAARQGCATGSLPGSGNADVIQDVNRALSASGLSTSAATITILVNDQPRNVASALRNDKITVTVAIPTAQAAWTGSFVFVFRNSTQSESTVMLRQG